MEKLKRTTISRRTVDRMSVDKDTVYWDRELSGFGVRVYASGRKVYVVQTRAQGRSRRVTVGRHGVITAEQARPAGGADHRADQVGRGGCRGADIGAERSHGGGGG